MIMKTKRFLSIDSRELHPYHFIDPYFKLATLAHYQPLGWSPGKSPIILNEYGWLWLNRDGSPTHITKDFYACHQAATEEQRRHLYARCLAAETEYWRGHRECAAVMQFCALGYSRPQKPDVELKPGDMFTNTAVAGLTSDDWVDVEKLTFDPSYAKLVGDAFSPVGLMIDAWAEEYPAGQAADFPVVCINDLDEPWRGTVRFRLLREGQTLQEKNLPAELPALGSAKLSFAINVPQEPGQYQVEAALVNVVGQPVCSLRDFSVLTPAEREARFGMVRGKPVTASSNVTLSGATVPAALVDGDYHTRWSSEFSAPQWVMVDLEKAQRINRVELAWDRAYGKTYALQVSLDGNSWQEVYQTQDGKGRTEVVRFAPTPARWVRLMLLQGATDYGFSLWEVSVFKE